MRPHALRTALVAAATAFALTPALPATTAVAADAASSPGRQSTSTASVPGTVARRAPDWTSITNNMVSSGTFTQAAIVTRDGGQTLATTGGIWVTDTERKTLARGFDYPGSISGTGLIISGRKYFVLMADEKVIIAKRDADYVFTRPTAQTILVGVNGPNTAPHTAQVAIDQITTSIRNQGY